VLLKYTWKVDFHMVGRDIGASEWESKNNTSEYWDHIQDPVANLLKISPKVRHYYTRTFKVDTSKIRVRERKINGLRYQYFN